MLRCARDNEDNKEVVADMDSVEVTLVAIFDNLEHTTTLKPNVLNIFTLSQCRNPSLRLQAVTCGSANDFTLIRNNRLYYAVLDSRREVWLQMPWCKH